MEPTEVLLPEAMPVNIEDEMKTSYLAYAMSVIIGRALPDVRDGLKPVHRRVLFAMHDLGNAWNKAYKKSARVVGDVIGKYHPHGDSAVYDTIVRMAQDFSLRYPLVDGQGNFGSVDGDAPAAMRYTEIRMSRLAGEMLADINKDTVDFGTNYDESLKEPLVLPARFPNLLVNGSTGIAVGMATNIPPHNLSEVINALVAYIDDPEISVVDLMAHIPGPDFPTGGFIYGREGIASAYMTGRGIVRLRARAEVETDKKSGRERIIVTEIPYQVNKAKMLEKMAELVRHKKLIGISDLRDESDRQGMRIVIELKRDAQGEIVLNQLFKQTNMQTSFGITLLAIVDRQPLVLNLKEMLVHFVEHRKDVVRRRTAFELARSRERLHLLAGFKIALDHLDEVIEIIRAAASPVVAREELKGRFSFSERQAQAILDLRLQRLTGMERDKIIQEHAEVVALIARLEEILASEKLVLDIIVKELEEIRETYGDERRCEIVDDGSELQIEDLIEVEEMVVTISRQGYIKRTALSTYRSYNRGAGGRLGMETRDGDFVQRMFVASTHDYLTFFTNQGRAFRLKVYQAPEGGTTSRGKALVNLLQLGEGEEVSAVLALSEFGEDNFVIMTTRAGLIKKLDLASLEKIRRSGIRCITLREGDEMIAAKIARESDSILLGTSQGQAIHFPVAKMRPTGRLSQGVIGCRMAEDDQLVGLEIFSGEEATVLTITENGFGKRSPIDDYPMRSRGGKGVITIKVNERNGRVVALLKASDADQIMMITDAGKITRNRVADVSVVGRNTMGVRVFRIDQEKERLVSVALLPEGVEAERSFQERMELGEIDAVDSPEGEVSELPETSEVVDDIVNSATEDEKE
ncbi:MAG: DNA gyrase subunit A [Pseudomonadota bacterium]|nr:DNA gyrase subunit A [Pseudomonadota bacterium]